MKLEWKQIIPAVLIGCLLGLWAGAWLPTASLRRLRCGGPQTQRLLSSFNQELQLDARQQEAVKAVLESYREKTKSLHRDTAARFLEIRASMRGDVERLLTPEQRKKFQDLPARWDAQHKNWKEASPYH